MSAPLAVTAISSPLAMRCDYPVSKSIAPAVHDLLDREECDQRAAKRDRGVKVAIGVIDGMRRLLNPSRKFR